VTVSPRPPKLHPGIGRAARDAASRTAAQKPSVWPRTREQRDWLHKLGNILDKLPKRLLLRVKAALREVMYSGPARRRARPSGGLRPSMVPAEHWKHLRTSNVVESPFATVRPRQRVTKGAGSRTKGLLMAYKLPSIIGASPISPA